MKQGWQEALKAALDPEMLLWDEGSLIAYSSDFHHLSPVLTKELEGRKADCVASPRTEAELDALIRVACTYRIPLTPRGGGTSNYGQSVPLTGGVVIDFSRMNRILELGGDFMRVEPGANIKRMEDAARSAGRELPLLPTTYKKSTIAGFVSGGFAGIGAVERGTIWDGLVRSLTIKTAEPHPRSCKVEGEEVKPYLHAYGTLGLIVEMEVSLVPKTDWKQWAVTFSDWESAALFGLAVAENAEIRKRLVSVDEWPIPAYFTPLNLSYGRSVVLLEIAKASEAAFLEAVRAHSGRIELEIGEDRYQEGIGVSDFAFGHSRLWVQKKEPAYTNMQISMGKDGFIGKLRALKEEFADLLIQIEFIRKAGELIVTARPIYKFTDKGRIARLIALCESVGIKADNSHTYDLAEGGRAYALEKMWEIKRRNDPLGLLNQNKFAMPGAERRTGT